MNAVLYANVDILTGYYNPPLLIGTCISNPKIVSSNENLASASQLIISAHFNRNKDRHNSTFTCKGEKLSYMSSISPKISAD